MFLRLGAFRLRLVRIQYLVVFVRGTRGKRGRLMLVSIRRKEWSVRGVQLTRTDTAALLKVGVKNKMKKQETAVWLVEIYFASRANSTAEYDTCNSEF